MTMTIKDNGHADQGDKRDDLTDIPNDIPSDHLRTKNPKNGPEISENSPYFSLHSP